MTAAVLRLEREQLESQARAEQDYRLWLAMWKLEYRVSSTLAVEDNRPYNQYNAVYATARAFVNRDGKWRVETVLEPSPLLDEKLPDWIALHFQTDGDKKWTCPEVLTPKLVQCFDQSRIDLSRDNCTPDRDQLLRALKAHLPPGHLLAEMHRRGEHLALTEPTLELANFNFFSNDGAANTLNAGQPGQQLMKDAQAGYQGRVQNQSRVAQEGKAAPQKANRDVAGGIDRDPEAWFALTSLLPVSSDSVAVSRGPLVRLWLTTGDTEDRLIAARLVNVGEREVCQGIVLDWGRLQKVLADEVADLLPDVRFEPMRDLTPRHPERTMINLPIEVIPGGEEFALSDPGWTPLRVGLALAWAAALIALLAVGLGSWSLLDLSERRIRFVSAVTHELRTPLTTLRLYLDMLTGGLVREEQQKEEYLHTLHAEADRLHRLIANVLDFSRLEDQRPRLVKSTVKLGDLLEQVRTTWQARCLDAGKELIVENAAGDALLQTDFELTQQILGNLIDNACKYSRSAEDRRIWLRAHKCDLARLTLEVEDRGPGVLPRERRSIFRPFRRGRDTETTGGVGLGLALAQRWAKLLGGQLSLRPCAGSQGACFQLELPICGGSA
jgi:signal transduction histidine kinase